MIPRFDRVVRVTRSATRCLAPSLVVALSAHAQQGNATLRGRVLDKASKAPISAAEIRLVTGGRTTNSDSSGRYVLAALPAGEQQVVVVTTAYPVFHFTIALGSNEDLVRDIELDSAPPPTLPEVTVKAKEPVSYRLVDFERRRRIGRGQYLTRDEIERNGSSNLQDAVRAMRGVLVECGGGGGCFARMARAPMRCLPDYVVDGRVDNSFGPTTPIRDIEAVEVYTGPGDVPGEFAGSSAGCGVIVIWTRSGPPPKKK